MLKGLGLARGCVQGSRQDKTCAARPVWGNATPGGGLLQGLGQEGMWTHCGEVPVEAGAVKRETGACPGIGAGTLVGHWPS